MARTNLSGLDDAALVRDLAAKQRDLVKGQFAHSLSRLQNTSSLGRLKGDIARIHTELRRREIAAGLSKNSLVSKHHAEASSGLRAGAAEAASGTFLSGVVDKLAE